MSLSGVWPVQPVDDLRFSHPPAGADWKDETVPAQSTPSIRSASSGPYGDALPAYLTDGGALKQTQNAGAWFRRTFDPPRGCLSGRRAMLHFRGMAFRSVTYVNGQKVGEWALGQVPVEYDVTGQLRAGAPKVARPAARKALVVGHDAGSGASRLNRMQQPARSVLEGGADMRAVLTVLLIASICGSPQAYGSPPFRALCLGMCDLQTAADVESLLTRCDSMGINALVIDSYYYDRNVAYLSDLFPHYQFGEIPDQLGYLLEKAKPRGIQVHLWYGLATGRPDMEGASLNEHPDWQVEDWRGVRIPWLDYGKPEVRAYCRDLMLDVVRRYPVDGITFDYIRYCLPDECYCDTCRSGFTAETGYDPLEPIPLPVSGEIGGNPVATPTTATVLARFENGSPAIATSTLGEGKVLLANYIPFGDSEAAVDAVARSALRLFGAGSGRPVYLLDTPENDRLYPGVTTPGRTWMTRVGIPCERIEPEGLRALPAGSYALAYQLDALSDEQALAVEDFVRAGGGLIWADPSSFAITHPEIQRVLGFAEPGRFFRGRHTIEATDEQSWLPGTEIPPDRRNGLVEAWQQYRMANITSLVVDVSRGARAIRPDVRVNAFVFQTRAAGREVLQDWGGWLEQGLLDYVFPMSYYGEETLAADLEDWRAADPRMEHIVPSLSCFDKSRANGERTAYLTPDELVHQIGMCEAAGANGFCLFALGHLQPNQEEALRAKFGPK